MRVLQQEWMPSLQGVQTVVVVVASSLDARSIATPPSARPLDVKADHPVSGLIACQRNDTPGLALWCRAGPSELGVRHCGIKPRSTNLLGDWHLILLVVRRGCWRGAGLDRTSWASCASGRSGPGRPGSDRSCPPTAPPAPREPTGQALVQQLRPDPPRLHRGWARRISTTATSTPSGRLIRTRPMRHVHQTSQLPHQIPGHPRGPVHPTGPARPRRRRHPRRQHRTHGIQTLLENRQHNQCQSRPP